MRTFSSLLLLAAVAVAVCSADAPRFRPAQRQLFGQFARQELAPEATFDTTTAEGPYPPAGSQRPGREFPLPSETEAPFNGDDSDDSDDNEQTTTASTATTDGPYAPSGWQPAGRLLALPAFQRHQQQPGQLYGAPSQEYGAPETTTDFSEFGETEASAAAETNETTDEPESELLPGSAQLKIQKTSGSTSTKVEKLQKQQQQQEQTLFVTPATYFVQLPSGQLQQISAPAGAVSSAAYYQLPGVPTASAGLLSAQLQQQRAAFVYPTASRYVAAAPQEQPQFVQFGQLVASPQAVSYSSQYRAEQSW